MDEDDDFGEFGGFEVAEPVQPAANAAQPVTPRGVEASPSPWAILSAGSNTVGVRPDLLCGENKFPQLLDPTVPCDPIVTNGGVATAGSSTEEQVINAAPGPFQAPVAAQSRQEQQHVNLDDVNLANEILDGSFRSASCPDGNENNSNSNTYHTHSALNDQGEASGHSSDNVLPTSQSFYRNSNSLDISAQNVNNDADIPFTADFSSNFRQENSKGLEVNTERNPVLGAHALPDNHDLPKDTEVQVGEVGVASCGQDVNESSLSFVNIPKQETEITSAENPMSSVNSTGIRKQSDASAIKANQKLAEEVQKLQDESRVAVASVVKEYKELMLSNIEKQQEATEQHVKLCLKQQEETFQQLLREQKKEFEAKLEEEREKMKQEKTSELEQQTESLKEQYDKILEDEREKNVSRLQTALEEERTESRSLLSTAVQEERERTQTLLKEEREKFSKMIQEERQKNEERMTKALEVQSEKFQESLHETVLQERKLGEDMLKLADNERENRNLLALAVQQRQLSCLDVFLEGAKQQLSLLMDSSDSNKSDNSKEENS